jgi:hypothetical protein
MRRILDEKAASGLDHKFEAPRWSPPPVLIKVYISWALLNKHLIIYWCIWDIWSPANLVASCVHRGIHMEDGTRVR